MNEVPSGFLIYADGFIPLVKPINERSDGISPVYPKNVGLFSETANSIGSFSDNCKSDENSYDRV